MPPDTAEILRRIRALGVARPRDLPDVSRSQLLSLCDTGLLERVGRGLYVPAGAEGSEHHDLALAGQLAARTVVCLISALRFHRLTTQSPHEVWIAIANKQHPPRINFPKVEVVRMSGPSLTTGVEVHRIEKVPVRIVSAAEAVADCFKFRNRIGLDVALEALRDFRRLHRGQTDLLWEYAGTCRVRSVLRPYLEAS